MSRISVAMLVGLLAYSAAATGQNSLAWLMGRWSERIRPKGGLTDRSPKILQVEVVDGVIRIIEGGDDGDDMRCRLDGAETRSTQVKSKATVEYMLKCKASTQSLEIHGRSIATGMSGIPPQQFEIEKKYELAKDGSLRARFRIRVLVQGFDPIEMADERTDFARSP